MRGKYMSSYFDSRNTFYRSPFGAVEQDTTIHLRILLPNSVTCHKAEVVGKYDNDQQWIFTEMKDCGMFNMEEHLWECDVTVDRVGLYWYNFRLHTTLGLRYLVPTGDESKCKIDRSPGGSWQLTCYKRDFKTPSWPLGGVIYQIFPDRFCFSGEEKETDRDDREYMNWDDQPRWWPHSNGEITNTDFFKGDLKGIEQKLDYLKDLNVSCIYLTPIFEARSNHRYDTGNYDKVDPLLGTNEDFERLCVEAEKRGIRILNDGVFSHTGCDSIYFNMFKRYGENTGAYNDKNSPYTQWYIFNEWPNNYSSWWGFYTLPEVHEMNPSFKNHILGENGVVEKWMNKGSFGWRLDVADELPDEFICEFRNRIKQINPDSLLIGEVWEDASNKESYGHRRQFLLGDQVDSVTNYVFRNAILDFLKGTDSKKIMDSIMQIVENYPRPVLGVMMNILSTHDTSRALTVLAGEPLNNRDRHWQANTKLTAEQYSRGIKLLKLAVAMQYTLPGIPCVYYGDEAGVEGYHDPFNRTTYPWGRENGELISWHKQLGNLRKECKALWDGDMIPASANGRYISYIRRNGNISLYCGFNSGFHSISLDFPLGYQNGKPILGTQTENGKLIIPSLGCAFVLIEN